MAPHSGHATLTGMPCQVSSISTLRWHGKPIVSWAEDGGMVVGAKRANTTAEHTARFGCPPPPRYSLLVSFHMCD